MLHTNATRIPIGYVQTDIYYAGKSKSANIQYY
jgi:hypothetical protein